MKATPEDLSQLATQLRGFLNDAGWSQRRQAKGLAFYYPPETLGIQGRYSVALPEDTSKPGIENLLHGAANSLAEIYGYGRLGDLLNRAASLSDLSWPTRIVSRFIDRMTLKGA
ncbi:MAG: hypothetical protein NTV37_10755, partial [Proteobacteria bacterium]|nr:hypothetical protein [Pseudomonadota bacterium]